MMTPRERVRAALRFETPDRVPRHVWSFPASRAVLEAAAFFARWPVDLRGLDSFYAPSPRARGDRYAVGESVDEWGVVWRNAEAGHVGEVKAPILPEIEDWPAIRPPYEILPEGASAEAAWRDRVDRACAETDLFTQSGCCPRPWERYQFLRGTENALIDLMEPEEGCLDLLRRIHEYHLRELELWVKTDVDGIKFMDDWGSQRALLINPELWRAIFKPLYRDYCDLAKAHGKFVFMHSDGAIQAIYPDLIELGVDAINSQLFCMDLAALAETAKGRITFWGEIDRQHVMNAADPEAGRAAVRAVASHLYDPRGGVIAQFEFACDANLAVAEAIFDEWDAVAATPASPAL